MRVNEKTTDFELRVAGKMQRLITSVVNKSLKNYLHKQQRMGANEQKNTAFLYSFINKLPSTILPNPEPRTPNPEPRTPNPEPRTPNPEIQTQKNGA